MLRLPLPFLVYKPRSHHFARVWPQRTSSDADRSASGTGINGGVVQQAGLPFRILTIATVLSILALVALGGVVRLTDSGLGCPDWPLCHGRIIPPLDGPTLIEYSHRLMASVVGLLVLAVVLAVWRSYRRQPWLLVPATLGFVALVAQVLLGGFTVLRELPPEFVLAHLATAEALMACMMVVCIVALCGSPVTSSFRGHTKRGRDLLPFLTLATVLATFTLLLTGGHVAVSGATAGCGQEWPLCQGQLFPEGYYPITHMVHRVFALLSGSLIVTAVAMAWLRRRERPPLARAAVAAGGLFLVQVLVGGATVLMGFPIAVRLLHLTLATVVWMGLAAMAVLSFNSPRQDIVVGVGRA